MKKRTDLMHSGTRCTARRKNGEPCTNWAMLGTNVCRMHGGAAPQVRRAAQVRNLMAADRLMAQLIQIAEDKTEPTPVRLAAIRDALDRAGLGARQAVEVEMTGKVDVYAQLLANVVVDNAITADEDDLSLPPSPQYDGVPILDAEVVEEAHDAVAEATAQAKRKKLPPSQIEAASDAARREVHRRREALLKERLAEKPKPDGSRRLRSQRTERA